MARYVIKRDASSLPERLNWCNDTTKAEHVGRLARLRLVVSKRELSTKNIGIILHRVGSNNFRHQIVGKRRQSTQE